MQKYHFYGSYTRNLSPILRAKDVAGLGRFNFYPKVSSNSKKKRVSFDQISVKN